MGRENKNRKNRLDKGGATEFIGFSAFATADVDGSTSTTSTAAAPVQQQHQWSPVYTGTDPHLQQLFGRILNKRDVTTKIKALVDLHAFFAQQTAASPSTPSPATPTSNIPTKKQQAQALYHYAWLYCHKLHYDCIAPVAAATTTVALTDSPSTTSTTWSLRKAALTVWKQAIQTLPKVSKTLLTEATYSRELAGMVYTAALLEEDSDSMFQEWLDEWDWQNGIMEYIQHMLELQRPSQFYNAILAPGSKQQSSSQTKGPSSGYAHTLDDRQREVVEERHERVLATTLQTLQVWLRDQKHCRLPLLADTDDATLTVAWWKTLTSSKPRLRRHTYQVLTTVALERPTLLCATDMVETLASVITQEKEASNWPILLESILSVLTMAAKGTTTETISSQCLHKPLLKVCKKALYGARVSLWGPMYLPLMARLYHTNNSTQNALAFCQALWEGRKLTLGGNDQVLLLLAIAECCSFCLLRKMSPDVTQVDDTIVQEIAAVWLQVLKEGLSTELQNQRSMAMSNNTSPVYQLLRQLATNIGQFEDATEQARECDFGLIQEWFWSEGMRGVFVASDKESEDEPEDLPSAQAMAKLLEFLVTNATTKGDVGKDKGSGPFLASVQILFQRHLQQFQGSSGSVPTEQEYDLFKQVFAYCEKEPALAFGDDAGRTEDSLDRFVVNDLLRWVVIHTSTLSTQRQTSELVRNDFLLLGGALTSPSLASKKTLLWETLLREIVAAQCDLEWLVVGMKTLVEMSKPPAKKFESVNWMRCSILDELALDVGFRKFPSSDQSTSGNLTIARQSILDEKRSKFLRLCVEISAAEETTLIDEMIFTKWIDHQCPSIESEWSYDEEKQDTVLLDVLLELVERTDSFCTQGETERILLSSLQADEQFFSENVLPLFKRKPDLCEEFTLVASAVLNRELGRLCLKSQEEEATRLAKVWAARAGGVIAAARILQKNGSEREPKVPSLELLGLSDVTIWETHPDSVFIATSCLLEKEAKKARLGLVMPSNEGSTDFLLSILVAISEASTDAVAATDVKFRQDKTAKFLSLLGGRDIDYDHLDSLIQSTISRCGKALISGGNDKECQRLVAVLSQLIELRFKPLAPPKAGLLDPATIDEGGHLWYIKDAENPGDRERVEIVKAHYDAQTGYFFTIAYDRDGERQERQTVVERLRRSRVDQGSDTVSLADIPDEERRKRGEVRGSILDLIILPHLVSSPWSSLVGELLCVITSNIGLEADRGIGSQHYELLQCLRKVEVQCTIALDSAEPSKAIDALWKLSLALGFGLSTPSSNWIIDELPLILDPIQQGILKYYSGLDSDRDDVLDMAVLAWLATSIGWTREDAYQIQFDTETSCERHPLQLLFELVASKLEKRTRQANDFSSFDQIICRAFQKGLALVSERPSCIARVEDDVAMASQQFVICFAKVWDCRDGNESHDDKIKFWAKSSYIAQIMMLHNTEGFVRNAFRSANTPACGEALAQALFSPAKRFYAFQLLDSFALTGKSVYEEMDLEEHTLSRLKQWVDGFEEEEAEEIEEDVEIAAEWLPRRIMSEMEFWGQEVYEETDEATAIGRFLSWLIVLRVVDVVAPKDFRYRPAFVSYLSQCGATNAALNLALLNDEAINSTSRNNNASPALLDIDILLQDEKRLTIPNLASLVLFRTVEILPSLSRKWWEESCPKVYRDDVQTFVEKHVAPEILKRELGRIRGDAASAFGEMNVGASVTSREVKATYVQDDLTLSVWIMLPPAFPFRSAQVDCSKTLGVPQERWKRWSLQITLMLNSQGGTLQDALLLWKDNVDKEFDGVEPCPVCYSVLHVKTHKLPALECKTCHNRFHVDCLTQWFRSSGKSQCVLCQQPWQGTRVS